AMSASATISGRAYLVMVRACANPTGLRRKGKGGHKRRFKGFKGFKGFAENPWNPTEPAEQDLLNPMNRLNLMNPNRRYCRSWVPAIVTGMAAPVKFWKMAPLLLVANARVPD